jgi:hypothetical protein
VSIERFAPTTIFPLQPQRVRDSSITIGPEWQMLEEITFARLQKLQLNVQEPEDLSTHGTIYSYEKVYDSVNTRNDKPLQIIDMVKYNTTTSDDPVIHSVSRAWPFFPNAREDRWLTSSTHPRIAG